MSAHPGDRLVLEELATVQAAVRQLLALSPHADPVELLRGQTLTTLAGARYAVQDVALHDGTLALSVVPLTPSTVTITVTQAPTSAEVADVRPVAPTPADVAARVRPVRPASEGWLSRPGARAAVSVTRRADQLWQSACDQHGDLDVHSTQARAHEAALRHAELVHGCSVNEAGEGR